MTSPQNESPSKMDTFVENARKLLIPGGATAGVAGAFWSLFGSTESDFAKAIASASIGFALSIGSYLLGPLASSTKRRAGHAGKVFDEKIERLFASVTGFEGKYLLCQAWDCEGVRSEGMRDRDGIFEPELKDVFVELQIDGNSRSPGFWERLSRRPQADLSRNQTIWEILAETETQKPYRQLAILAWGGSGKTTLLKHVAYRYGTGEAPPDAPNLVPVLMVLRKYREHLSQAEPPDLPTLINEYHIPSLPESNRLRPVPPTWAKDLLERGRALVMFDGFDEVPRDQRPAVVKWIREQIKQYGRSVFIVTSRPKAYRDEEAVEQLSLAMPLWVQPFDDDQRRNFVNNWYQCQERLKTRRDTPEVRKVATSSANELLNQIESQSELKDLAKNPLLLNMIATFHRLYPGSALPKRRTDLYGEICTLQIKERPRGRRLKTVLLEFEAQPVLEQVAFSMMQRELKRIDEDDLLTEIRNALAGKDEEIDASELLKDITRISELMVQQEDEYEFAHLSFQEYLAAAYVAANPTEREKALYKKLKEAWWKSTILLYVSMTKKPDRLIREAMQRGQIGLCYECLQQTTRRIDNKLVEQIRENRYADLDGYLRRGQWEEADRETYRLMITEVGKEEEQWFDREDLLNFPCEPLRVIDALWVTHSGGRFGFSVQKDLYLKCGGVVEGKYHKEAWRKFCDRNGWRQDGRSVNVRYDMSAPDGHLPFSIRDRIGMDGGRGFLFSRTQTCKL